MDALGTTLPHEGFTARPLQRVDMLGISIPLQELKTRSRAQNHRRIQSRSPSPNPEQCITRTEPITASEALLRLPPIGDSPLGVSSANGSGLNMTVSPAKPANLSFSTETVKPPAWDFAPAYKGHSWEQISADIVLGTTLSVKDGMVSPSREDRSETAIIPNAAFQDFLKSQKHYQEEISSSMTSIQGLVRSTPLTDHCLPAPPRLSSSQLAAPPPTPVQSTTPAWTSSPIRGSSSVPLVVSPVSAAKVIVPQEASSGRVGTLQGPSCNRQPTPSRAAEAMEPPPGSLSRAALSAARSSDNCPTPTLKTRHADESYSKAAWTSDTPRSASANNRRVASRNPSPCTVHRVTVAASQPSRAIASTTSMRYLSPRSATRAVSPGPARSKSPGPARRTPRETYTQTLRYSSPRQIPQPGAIITTSLCQQVSQIPGLIVAASDHYDRTRSKPRSVSPRRIASVTRRRSVSPRPVGQDLVQGVTTSLVSPRISSITRSRSVSPRPLAPTSVASAKLLSATSCSQIPMPGTISMVAPSRIGSQGTVTSAPSSVFLHPRHSIAKEFVPQANQQNPTMSNGIFHASPSPQTPRRSSPRAPTVGMIHVPNGPTRESEHNHEESGCSRASFPAPMPVCLPPRVAPLQEKAMREDMVSQPSQRSLINGVVHASPSPQTPRRNSPRTQIVGMIHAPNGVPRQPEPSREEAASSRAPFPAPMPVSLPQRAAPLQDEVTSMGTAPSEALLALPGSLRPSAFYPDPAVLTPRFSFASNEQEPDEDVLEQEISDAANATEAAHSRLRDALSKLQDLNVSSAIQGPG